MEPLKNTKPYFFIDGQPYTIESEGTSWMIGKSSRLLVTQVVVSSNDIQRDIAKGLLDEYHKDGRIKMYTEAFGIFNNGAPVGKFTYEADRDAENYLYFRKEGLEYRLDFFGTVQYDRSWVYIKGELKPPYDKRPVFEIDAALQFDPQQLDWTMYGFKSLEETREIESGKVHFLEITNPSFKELPAEIYDFVNLENLSIVNQFNYLEDKRLPLEVLDERIGRLKQLKGISINKATIQQLPLAIGSLRELENVNLSLCQLEAVPEEIWRLPKLNYLILSNNCLTSIPDNIHLPALLTLSVEGNRLKTLPESLLQLPRIKKIMASGNPFAFLPERFSFFRGLDLSMAEKKKLLDNTYRGADGKGTEKWDDKIFLAGKDKSLIKPVEQLIKEHGLSSHKQALLSLMKRTVGLNQTTTEDYVLIGNHRFGGRPDLPLEMHYPTFYDEQEGRDLHYEFIAQINCEEINALQDYLPRTGSLFFFFKSIHYFGMDDNTIGKVVYVEDNGKLVSGKRFELEEEDFLELPEGQYQPYKAEAFTTVTAPSFFAYYNNEYLFEGKAKSLREDEDLLENAYDELEEQIHTMHPFDYGMNAYGFTQHESPELQAALSLKGNPQDWIILLLVKSRGDFQWGDAGDLFFVIHKSDLLKKNFSRVFVTLESS